MSYLRKIASLALAVLATSVTSAQAQADYPNRPVTLVVPFSAGGSTDATARLYGNALSEVLGQPVVIENRGGGGGTVGADYVANAAPDGYTLFFSPTGPVNFVQHIMPGLTYDPETAFQPIAAVAQGANVMLAPPNPDLDTLQEILDYGRANPGALRFGSPGVGSLTHILIGLINARAGIEVVHVPYAGGAPVVNDLLGGRIELGEASLISARPHVEAGNLNIIAFMEPERFPAYPDIPSIEEAIPGAGRIFWFGVLAPAGVSPEVVERVAAATAEVLSSEELLQGFENVGLRPLRLGTEEFTALITREIADYAQMIEDANLDLGN